MSEKFLWKTGEKAPVGFYTCAKCNDGVQTIVHDNAEEKLPACKKCGATIWAKV